MVLARHHAHGHGTGIDKVMYIYLYCQLLHVTVYSSHIPPQSSECKKSSQPWFNVGSKTISQWRQSVLIVIVWLPQRRLSCGLRPASLRPRLHIQPNIISSTHRIQCVSFRQRHMVTLIMGPTICRLSWNLRLPPALRSWSLCLHIQPDIVNGGYWVYTARFIWRDVTPAAVISTGCGVSWWCSWSGGFRPSLRLQCRILRLHVQEDVVSSRYRIWYACLGWRDLFTIVVVTTTCGKSRRYGLFWGL